MPPKPRHKIIPAQSEAQLHKQVAQYLARALRPPTIWTTIGHGGGGKARGARLKAMGMKAGWPDILVMHPSVDASIVLGIELKSPRGDATREQDKIANDFDRVGAVYEFCWSVEDVIHALKYAGVPYYATVMGSGIRVAA